MTQDEVKASVEQALDSSMHAYWGTRDLELREQIKETELSLHDVYDQLLKNDLESRTEDFQTAANTMRDTVIPAIRKLDASVAHLVKAEDVVKTALADLMKVTLSTTFFKIPTI